MSDTKDDISEESNSYQECCFCGSEISKLIIAYHHTKTAEVLCGTCIQTTASMMLTRNVFLTWDDVTDIQMNQTYEDEL